MKGHIYTSVSWAIIDDFYVLIDESITSSKQLLLKQSFENSSERSLLTILFVGHKT